MTLRLHNTLTRTKEDFVPLDPANVRMYVCGPTVYDYAHIGNARPVIVFDVLFRLLRHLYGPEHVTYVRNITDVDDKINARAAEEGISIRELTEKTARQFHEDIAALGVLPPTVEPRATDHIAEMIAMIEELLATKPPHAYPAEGHVLFDVSSKPDYGKLARRSLDEMIAGARVDPAPYKRNPTDFVLWKPSDAATPGWDSPWGRGRPGWHLECSAMSNKYLGETFDIHGGGIDLVFPHHENEIAQSEGAHHDHPLARYWLHNGHLQVEGAKMSKSLGNFVTIHDLLKDWDGEVLRFNMLRSHYRQPMDWTLAGVKESEAILDRWAKNSEGVEPKLHDELLDALCDDLNTPMAMSWLHQAPAEELAGGMRLLGFSGRRPEDKTVRADLEEAWVDMQISARAAAKKAKNFAEADRIRNELDTKGIVLKDNKDGTTTWEVKR
jgi:cysteinyl-tRNA synthetase